MKVLDRIKRFFGIGEVTKVKKVTAGDIQRNLRKIQDRMNELHQDIDRVNAKMTRIERDASENDEAIYRDLQDELRAKNELYSTLQTEMKNEYDALKKFRDSRFTIPPEKGIMVGSLLFIGVFALALERENPKALKLAQFILKLFPIRL